MTSPTYQLTMRNGPTPDKVYELSQAVVNIGRDYANDIVINHPEISRRHARLTVQGGSYILEDLGSTNGAFVNGQRLLGPHLLRPGELISFGDSVRLSFDIAPVDLGATTASPVGLPAYQPPAAPPVEQPAAQRAAASQTIVGRPASAPAAQQPAEALAPYYSGQIPSSPAYAAPAAETPKASRSWIFLGIGCLLVFLIVCIGAAFVFDTLNLYCVHPFQSLFTWLYTCP
jgi:predicted component of type VI protein secretion system